MKKVLTALLIVLMMVTFTACSKKEEAGEEELYTVNIKNDSGVTVYKVGIKFT